MDQRTDEWFAARLGKVTASRIADVMAKGKGSAPSATRTNYKAQLICERLTDVATESFSSAAMQWGTDTEPQARASYELETLQSVQEVGFIPHPFIEWSGASPDGLVSGGLGLVEIKCPNTATHIDTLLGAPPSDKYMKQMQWQMACTGAEWCDFVSFDPRMPHEMRLKIIRVHADHDFRAEIEAAVIAFLSEVEVETSKLQKSYPARGY